jgi:hypothetical protein
MNLNATTEDMLTAIRVLGGEGTTVELVDRADGTARALGYVVR